MLKKYTIEILTEEKRTQYLQTQDLSKLAVFEDGNDIFINLHLPEVFLCIMNLKSRHNLYVENEVIFLCQDIFSNYLI